MTINACSARSIMKWAQMSLFLRRYEPDIVFIQETNTDSPTMRSLPMYDFHFTTPHVPHAGTAIAVKKSVSICSLSRHVIVPGYALALKVSTNYPDRQIFVFISIYGPHMQDNAVELMHLVNLYIRNTISSQGNQNAWVIVGGDFNCTLVPRADRTNGIERYPRYAAALRHLVNQHRLVDVWRRLRTNNPGYTHLSHSGIATASRLDRFYISEEKMERVRRVETLSSFSDHKAVMMWLTISHATRKSPYWRFDNSLLESEEYCKHVNLLATSMPFLRSSNGPISTWELIKSEIKEHAIIYKRGLRMNTQHDEGYYAREAKALVAKVGWEGILANDAPATAHLSQWASKEIPKPITRLKIGGRWESDPSKLAAEGRKHFADVFSPPPTTNHDPAMDTESFLSTLTPLTEDDCQFLETPLSADEVLNALKSLSKNKSPGIDGLTPEFYLRFWDVLKKPFLRMIHASFERGKLPRTSSTSVITLMPKTDKVETVDSLRPLSITNTDYKILAKALSNRLSKVISSLVSEEQSYCIPGRTIYDSIACTRDLINLHTNGQEPLAVISLDQKKAFDNVSHAFLFSVMDKMGFGVNFSNMIKTLYTNSLCMVRIASNLTSPIPFRNGIRQGCPLSGQLYSIAFEPLIRKLRHELTPVIIPGQLQTNIVASAYADDITVYINNDGDFSKITECFATYSTHSGAKLNMSKSRGLWVGPWQSRDDDPLGLQWSKNGFKCLGAWIDVNPERQKEILDTEIRERITKAIRRWTPIAGPMSLRGRVLVCNQFIAPTIWHILHSYSPSENTIRRLQAMLVNFVWSDRKHWVTKEIVSTPLKEGGLGLVDISSKLIAFRYLTAQRIALGTVSSMRRALALECIAREWEVNDPYTLFTQTERIIPSRRIPNDRLYHSVMMAWKIYQVTLNQHPQLRIPERPAPTGWPPPSPPPTFKYHSRRQDTSIVLPLAKSIVYKECLYIQYSHLWPLKGKHTDDEILWLALRRWPTLGVDADIAWRLCHGAWADGVFLSRVGHTPNDRCPWCPDKIASAWHLAFLCQKVKKVWKAAVSCAKLLTGMNSMLLLYMYAGIPLRASVQQQGIALANYLFSLVKSTIHREVVLYYKNKINDVNYTEAIKKKFLKRLTNEKAYHSQNGNEKCFLRIWAHNNVFIDQNTGNVNENCPLFTIE